MGKEEFKNPHPELPVREPILKLGKMITDRVPIKLGFEKLTADSPEYWGLAPICTDCLLYTSPSPRDISGSRMPSSA